METFGGQVTIFVIVLNIVRPETLTPPRLYLCFLLIEYIFGGPSAQFTAEIILRGGLRSSHPPPLVSVCNPAFPTTPPPPRSENTGTTGGYSK